MSDASWAVITPLLPPPGQARGRWRDHRHVLEGIMFKFRTGLLRSAALMAVNHLGMCRRMAVL
ncbi:transposase [Streptomyces sp. NPDC004721]